MRHSSSFLFALCIVATLSMPVSAHAYGPGARTARSDSSSRSGRSGTAKPIVEAATLGEAVLVEVRVGQFASRAVMAYETDDNMLLVRASDVLDIAEIEYARSASRVHGKFAISGVAFEFNSDEGIARHGRERWRVSTRELVASNVGVVASLPVIARVLGVDIRYDRESAAIDMRDVANLPIARRVARMTAHETYRALRKSESAATMDLSWLHLPSADVLPTVLLDYDAALSRHAAGLGGALNTAPWATTYNLNAALPVGGGYVRTNVTGENGSLTMQSVNWSRAWPDGRNITRLQVGDGALRGTATHLVRGLWMTNAPMHADGAVSKVSVSGELQDGWDIEATNDGKIVDLAAATLGRYDLTVPVSVGANTIDFVASGPNGEERTFRRTVRTPPLFVRPGHTEYAVAGGVCTHESLSADVPCSWAGNADVRRALNGTWMGRVGADLTQYAGATHALVAAPYVGLGAMVSTALSLETTYQPTGENAGLTGFTAQYAPSPALMISTDFARSDLLNEITLRDGFQTTSSTPIDVRETTQFVRTTRRTTMARFAPERWDDHFALEGWESSQWWTGSMHTEVRFGVAVQRAGIQAHPYVRSDMMRSGTTSVRQEAFGVESMIVPGDRLAALVHATWLRSIVEVSKAGASTVDATMGFANNGWRMEAGVRHSTASGYSFNLSVAPQLSKLHLGMLGSATSTGMSTTTESVRGSAVVDVANRRVMLDAEPAMERGGVSGVIFLDRNGNGRRDAGEPGLPGVVIRAGNHLVTSDSTGAYSVWGLAAFAELRLSVDSTTLSSPWWLPSTSGVRTRVPGNGLARVDMPIVVGGIIEGSVTIPVSATHLRGTLRVLATNVETNERIVVTSFQDGTFYRDGMRPGTYVVSVDPGSAVGYESHSVTIHIAPTAEDAGTASTVRLALTERI